MSKNDVGDIRYTEAVGRLINTIKMVEEKENPQSSIMQRKSNIELFRILTMLLIIAHHYVVNSGVIDSVMVSPQSANSTFGVLLIHANSDAMRQWLWKDVVDCIGHYEDRFMPVYSTVCVLSIFVICVVIDIIRINIIEKPFFRLVRSRIKQHN